MAAIGALPGRPGTDRPMAAIVRDGEGVIAAVAAPVPSDQRQHLQVVAFRRDP